VFDLLMVSSERALFVAAGVAGCLAVAFGAFGAHALRGHLASLPDAESRQRVWETAAHYHLIHALAVAVAAFLAGRSSPSSLPTAAGLCFLGGIVLFSGSLYAMGLTGIRALGAITPFGGLAFIVGWALIALAAWRS
jgi:uncharacterized membrane protein YgdD (TMEM256/DUF423 family)